MSLVLHDGVGRKVEDSAQGVSDAGSGRLVTSSFVPDGDDILLETKSREAISQMSVYDKVKLCVSVSWFYLEAYWYHSTADLLSYHELLPEHGQDQIFPAPRGQAFPQTDDPLSTHFIGIILNTAVAKFSNELFIKKIKIKNRSSTSVVHDSITKSNQCSVKHFYWVWFLFKAIIPQILMQSCDERKVACCHSEALRLSYFKASCSVYIMLAVSLYSTTKLVKYNKAQCSKFNPSAPF